MTQTQLTEWAGVTERDLDHLTETERRAYVACRINGVGVREQARYSDRSPGTVGNLLARAERKLDQGGQDA